MTEALVVWLRWHQVKQSEAAHDALLRPLADQMSFVACGVEWGKPPPSELIAEVYRPVIFFQTPPPAGFVERLTAPVTWIPMWDSVAHKPQRWWNALPRRLRVVAFSEAVFVRARRAGLRTLHLQYASDPAIFAPVAWNEGRVAFYWNRAGVVSQAFLERFCAALQLDRLLVKNYLDPGYHQRLELRLPSRIGLTRIDIIPQTRSRAEYFDLIRAANILIAPRIIEGIGLTYLEAMARGCVVFAADRPTMNEVIEHGRTGVLLDAKTLSGWSLQAKRGWNRAIRLIGPYGGVIGRIRDVQPWDALAALDLKALAAQARQSQMAAHARWQASLPAYARFLRGEDVTISPLG